MGDAAAARKRRRGGEGGGMKRVAEIVMVLAAAGEMRGGREPTAAERALAAEARELLAGAVGGGAVRPRDLFPREAVCALVEDLGLNRAKDPAAKGFRPPKASIAERLLLTKRKMEEVKEAPVHTTYAPQTTVSTATYEFQGLHGAPKFTVGAPRNLSAVASLPATTPVTSVSPVILKQPQFNEKSAGVPSVKAATVPSFVALPHTGPTHLKLDKGVNGPPYLAQGGATTGQANKSLYDTAARTNQSAIQSSNQAVKNQDTKAPAMQAVTGNLVMGHQAPSGGTFGHTQLNFSNHNDIAKNVQQFLHQPVDHPSWTPPSTEYMHAPVNCQICKVVIMDVDSLLVCDACERGVHLKCLQHYGNKGIPKAEWYCPTCLAQSKGKPLPPKYGKVTRTIVAPKTAVPSCGTQLSSERAAENLAAKDNRQDVAVNGGVIKGYSNQAGSTVHDSVLALSATTVVTQSQSFSTPGPEKESVNYAETPSNQKKGNVPPWSSVVPGTVKSSNELQNSGLPTWSSTGAKSEISHKQSESSGLPSCTMSSENDSKLQPTAISEAKCSDHSSFNDDSDEKHQSEACSEVHHRGDAEMTNTRTPTDQTHHANGPDDGVKEPSNNETCDNNAHSDAMPDCGSSCQTTSNGNLCPKDEVVGGPKDELVGSGTALSVVDWVGDALRVDDDKTYYNSCNIDGLPYKLQDYILTASKDNKLTPSKLQSLWEEHGSGSKMAMVETYCFASDIPESISQPCTATENEVYASKSQRIIMASAIRGRCEVLQPEKFREEAS